MELKNPAESRKTRLFAGSDKDSDKDPGFTEEFA